MKNKSEVELNGKPVFYTVLYESFRKAALDCGYALALHGTMHNDMDMIAVPWVEDAKPIDVLVSKLSDCIGATVWKGHHFTVGLKPHGRIVHTLSIFKDWYIDLSIIPPRSNPIPKLNLLKVGKLKKF